MKEHGAFSALSFQHLVRRRVTASAGHRRLRPCLWSEVSWKCPQGERAAERRAFLTSPSLSIWGHFSSTWECPIFPSTFRPPWPCSTVSLTSPAHPGKRSISFEYRFSTSSPPGRTFHDTRMFSKFSTFNLRLTPKQTHLRWQD